MYTNHKDLHEIIKKINEKYYKPIDANIKTIEGLARENAIEFMRKLQDICNPLKKIFLIDVLIPANKIIVDDILKKYETRLQELWVETNQKVFDTKAGFIFRYCSPIEIQGMRAQVAAKLKEFVNNQAPYEKKKEGYKKMNDYLDVTLYNKKK